MYIHFLLFLLTLNQRTRYAEATPPQRNHYKIWCTLEESNDGALWAGPRGKIVGRRFITISTNRVYMPGAREFPYDL